MRDLAKSLVSFSGAMLAFGTQQLCSLVRSGFSTQPPSEATFAFHAVTCAAEGSLDEPWKCAFHTGQRFQDAFIDAMFDMLPGKPQSVNDLVLLPADVVNFVQATRQIVPSSTYLTQAMIDPLPLAHAKLVVEFGPGTGVMTRALLKRMPVDATLLTFEINSRFARQLRSSMRDPRLKVFEASAESLGDVLCNENVSRVDGVVSSLGLRIMPEERKHSIFRTLLPFLNEHSVVTQFQYLNPLQVYSAEVQQCDSGAFLSAYFSQVRPQTVWLNLPPVIVYVCRK